MTEKRNLYPFDSILKLMELGSYINNFDNADEIKTISIEGLYNLIRNDLVEKRRFSDISQEEFKLECLVTLNILKCDIPKIFNLYQKQINDIKISDILRYYKKSIERSIIHKKVMKYKDELFSKKVGNVYTVSQAQKIIGYSHKASIYNHISKHNLKVRKLSKRKTIISESDLDEFLRKIYKISLEEYIKLSPTAKKSLHKN